MPPVEEVADTGADRSADAGVPGCTDTCHLAGDGFCDDGRDGSDSSECALGTDCQDCASFPDPEPRDAGMDGAGPAADGGPHDPADAGPAADGGCVSSWDCPTREYCRLPERLCLPDPCDPDPCTYLERCERSADAAVCADPCGGTCSGAEMCDVSRGSCVTPTATASETCGSGEIMVPPYGGTLYVRGTLTGARRDITLDGSCWDRGGIRVDQIVRVRFAVASTYSIEVFSSQLRSVWPTSDEAVTIFVSGGGGACPGACESASSGRLLNYFEAGTHYVIVSGPASTGDYLIAIAQS